MTTIHIVSSFFPPTPGGLQLWTKSLAAALAEAGFRPIVYVCEHPAAAGLNGDARFEIVDVAPLVDVWLAPLLASDIRPQRLIRERARMAFACLKAEVARRATGAPQIVLSNFVTTAGFTAHLVAEELGLPHVAVVVGSDYTRGARNPEERYILQEVCGAARVVVAKSEEQRRGIARLAPEARLEVVGNSVDLPDRRWQGSPAVPIRIFSDSGFSFKKGSGVLIDSCRALAEEGIGVHLEICGGDRPSESAYWTERRAEVSRIPGLTADFPGQVNLDEVVERMLAADLYASATLGEGSSVARARALSVGIPMVTTRCGELAEDPGSDHVRLVAVADADGFRAALGGLAADLLHGRIGVDPAAVEAYRARFHRPERWAPWIAILSREAGPGAPSSPA